MITSVRGEVIERSRDAVTISVGGVGFRLQCPPTVSAATVLGESTRLAASLVVREDSLTLFGFVDADQRDVFDLLQSVSGIGPRIALAVLGVMSTDDLRAAIATGDERSLIRVPGIGRKGAQRLILELTDKIGPPLTSQVDVRDTWNQAGAGGSGPSWRQPVHEALMGLGWSSREADAAIDSVERSQSAALGAPGAPGAEAAGSAEPTVAQMLKLALRSMDRR